MTREERYIEYDEQIDRYLRNQMDDSERIAFEQDVDNDQELQERLVATAMLVKGIAQVGMQREGQVQLDAIKQMSKDEFIQATKGKKGNNPFMTFVKWASGIAAAAIVAYGLYTFYPRSSRQQPEMAEVIKEKPTKPAKSNKPVEPTLASLVDEYNKPFGNEPDEFVSIRQQIKNGTSKDMMAVVYDVDKVEWPTANHGPKGADDEEEVKNTTDNFNDCSHWYKALAYLKKGDKESAINELDELIEQGHNGVLIERATELLKKLKE
jgi:hypothetical protein